MKSLLALPLLAIAVPLCAEEIPTYAADEIVVTATRFKEQSNQTPANITTITRQDIQNSPATNLPDILKTRAGLEMRSLYGSQAIDTNMDLRGFGETGNSHVLVLLNGRRLNPINFDGINWSAIPLDSIERVEIIRGSGAVLYGDNAMSGVINIITEKTGEPVNSAAITVGSFNTLGAEASASGGSNEMRYDLFANALNSDAYRQNNQSDQKNLIGRISQGINAGELFAEVALSQMSSGQPGSVNASQLEQNPRISVNPNDSQKRESALLRGGIRKDLSPSWQFALEAQAESSIGQSFNAGWGNNSYRDTDITTLSLTPRLRWNYVLLGLSGKLIAGADFYNSRLDSDLAANPDGASTNLVRVDQDSRAFYLHNTTELSRALHLTFGARSQKVEQSASDRASTSTLDNNHDKTIGELGLSYQATPHMRLFGKTASTFRFAKTDDLTTYGGLGAPVRPEHGRSNEIGGELKDDRLRLQATFYDLKLTDEIAWNNLTWQNENLAKTLHRGLELDARWRLMPQLDLNASFSHTIARFRDGTNTGNTIPLVPKQKASLGLVWKPNASWAHSVVANYVGDRYFGGDESNSLQKLSGYTTLDWQTRWQMRNWSVTAKLQNLTDKKYAPLGYDYGYGASYYPANPLSAYLTIRRDFQ